MRHTNAMAVFIRRRAEVLAALIAGGVGGRLSPDTVVNRIRFVREATTSDELDFAYGDLPVAGSWLVRVSAALLRRSTPPRTGPAALDEVELNLALLLDGRGGLLIGRGSDCDIVVSEPSVSRHHARLVRHREHLLVEDLGSSNGTWLNARRVRRAVLKPGDDVLAGQLRIILTTMS